MSTFESLGLSTATLDVVRTMGFEEPTPIQTMVIPAILEGEKDLIGQAQTGTGKTAAFGLPILEKLAEVEDRRTAVQALVLTPTRELAIQVCNELNMLKGSKRLAIIPIYGGAAFGPQLRELSRGVDIVVGTPGRVLDHISRGRLLLDSLRFLVIDEADEMLQLGFQDEVEAILGATPTERRTFLFSATMPPPIQRISEKYMGEREILRARERVETSSLTDQVYYEIREADRFEALMRVVEMAPEFYGIIFCRTRTDTSDLAARMAARGHDVGALHGDFTQAQRESVSNRFRRRLIRILVATDVAARGIDIQDLTHVVNYAMPQNADAYVHRIGRTGRAGKKGTAVTLVTPADFHKLRYIQRISHVEMRKETLPSVKELIELKKEQIRSNIADSIAAQPDASHFELARELLTWCESDDLVAALLQQSYGGELDSERYVEIRQFERPKRPRDRESFQKGARLFITRGLNHGLTPKRLLKIIRRICKIPKESIHDLELGDSFGFVTLSRRDAKVLLEYYRAGRGKPLVTPMKRKDEKPRRPPQHATASAKKRSSGRTFKKGKSKPRSGDRTPSSS